MIIILIQLTRLTRWWCICELPIFWDKNKTELENQSEKEVEIVRSTALSEKEMEIIKSENFLKEIQICVKDLRKKLKKDGEVTSMISKLEGQINSIIADILEARNEEQISMMDKLQEAMDTELRATKNELENLIEKYTDNGDSKRRLLSKFKKQTQLPTGEKTQLFLLNGIRHSKNLARKATSPGLLLFNRTNSSFREAQTLISRKDHSAIKNSKPNLHRPSTQKKSEFLIQQQQKIRGSVESIRGVSIRSDFTVIKNARTTNAEDRQINEYEEGVELIFDKVSEVRE